ncbi:MAG: hypothetical protein R3D29_00405 [Nitratireductor sp.]
MTLGKLEGDAKLASASPSSSDMERLTSLGRHWKPPLTARAWL